MAVGKRVGGRLYVHRLAVPLLDAPLAEMVAAAFEACSAAAQANVLKIDEAAQLVSALEYPDFFETPFPALLRAWHIRIVDGRVSHRSYEDSSNPPVLHRKELLLPPRLAPVRRHDQGSPRRTRADIPRPDRQAPRKRHPRL